MDTVTISREEYNKLMSHYKCVRKSQLKYNKKNAEKKKAYDREYYRKNKEDILRKVKEKRKMMKEKKEE